MVRGCGLCWKCRPVPSSNTFPGHLAAILRKWAWPFQIRNARPTPRVWVERSHPMAKSQAKRSKPARKWSAGVTQHSHALDLEKDVFTQRSPERIAESLKRSAETSTTRKADPYRSAMSMLSFYINRAGRNLPQSRKRVLERAKDALRRKFGRG